MKKAIVAIMLMLMTAPVFALDTELATWDHHWMDEWERYKFDHHHGFGVPDDRENPLGLGYDFVVAETSSPYLEEVVVETRADLNNDEFAVYFVGRANLCEIVRDWF